MRLLTTLLTLIMLPCVLARADICQDPRLSEQPILADGRIMPLFVYASKLKSFMWEKGSCPELSPVEIFCRLSLQQLTCPLQLKIEHRQTRELIGASSLAELRQKQELMLQTYHELSESEQSSSGYATDLGNVLTRLDKMDALEAGKDWKVLNDGSQWVELANISPETRDQLILSSLERLSPPERRTLHLESLYEHSHPFIWAIAWGLLGFLFSLGADRSRLFARITMSLMALSFFTQLYAIALRVMISGRAPVTNMFETVMWVSLVAFTFAMILGFLQKNTRIWSFGFMANLCGLFMLKFANSMLDGAIQPLVPVLRDNFWLSTHVTAVVSSYACFALGWFIANTILLRQWFKARDISLLHNWNSVIRVSMQTGTVLLAAGVILGGVWADYSWGRFWGWDPKETWSLIALMVYVIILHGRYVGWFRDEAFTIMAGLAFLFVIMAWFGVNYILATGLHSYGFSSGGAVFIVSITVVQIFILLISTWQVWRRRKA